MLSRNNRLRRRRDFARVYREGRMHHSDILSIKSARSKIPTTRLAVVVSTKVSKKAVVRNRIRRCLQGELRTLLPQLKPGFDVIILARQESYRAPITLLQAELAGCLKRAGILE